MKKLKLTSCYKENLILFPLRKLYEVNWRECHSNIPTKKENTINKIYYVFNLKSITTVNFDTNENRYQ